MTSLKTVVLPSGRQIDVSDWTLSARLFQFTAKNKFAPIEFILDSREELLFTHATAWWRGGPLLRPQRVAASLLIVNRQQWMGSLPLLDVSHGDSTRNLSVPAHAGGAERVFVKLRAVPSQITIAGDTIAEAVSDEIAFEGLEEVDLLFQVLHKRQF